jgi:hypothetical protein
MAYNDDAQVFERQIVIENISQQAGVTSGSIVNKGTLSTLDTYITGHTVVNDVKITPNLNDIIYEQQAILANDQASFTNITDFFFDDSAATSFKAIINVSVSTGESKYAVWEINGLYKPNGWVITSSFTGDLTGVDFSISNEEGGIGQMQYKNSNTSGTTTIRYRATTTAPPGSTPIGVSGGVIQNTDGPFLSNNLIYANTDKTLASTDIIYNSNVFIIGGASRVVAEKTSDFVSFSNGGALTSMGDASIAKRVIVGEKVGIATTAPSYALDVVGDINFTGTFYKNNSIYSGSEIWGSRGTDVFYTQGNIGLGTTSPSYQLDVSGSARVTSAFQAETIIASTSVSSGLLSGTNITGTNVVATALTSGSINASNIISTSFTSSSINTSTLVASTYVSSGLLAATNATATNIVASALTSGSVVATTLVGSTSVSSGMLAATNATATNIVASALTSGSLVATTLVGSTSVSSGLLAATNATATNIVATALTSGSVNASDIVSTSVTSGSVVATTLVASTSVSSGLLAATNATATNIVATALTSGSINASDIVSTSITSSSINASTLVASTSVSSGLLAATNIIGTIITAGTLLADTITGANLSLSQDLIIGGTLTTVNITTTNVVDTNISTGTLSVASTVNVGTSISSGLLAATNITATNIVATDLTSGSVIATTSVSSGLLAATNITATNIVATDLTAGALKTSDIALNGNLVATGDITAFGSLSDRRLKTNIIDIDTESALNIVQSLRPVTFDWKDDIFNESKRGSHDVGFIAQEVEEVIPQAVADYKEMNSGVYYKNIKHERLIPYLVGAIQTLKLQLEELEKRL